MQSAGFSRGATLAALLLFGTACVAQDGTQFQGTIGRDIRDSTPHFPSAAGTRPGAPNVVIILADDLGYADLGAYGSEIETPALDRLAASGLRYSRFTATAICSPSRAALLTGLNHHSAGLGWLANADWGYPGYRGELTRDAVTLAEILQTAGYATMMVGKWHLTASEDLTPAGPFDNWPTGRGFDRYYGFIDGEVSQWYPHQLISDTRFIAPPADGSFYLPDALTDHAVRMIHELRNARPDKPFFLYYATGATHAPHHVKPADRDKYRHRFDEGWDAIRAQRLARQKAIGLVPRNTALAPYSPGVVRWDSLGADQKRMYARLQENYAGFADNLDQNVGRLLDYIRSIGELDNTIVVFTSDNGASREVGVEGTTNAPGHFYHFQPATTAGNLRDYDAVGSWRTHPHYPHGWMQASNTPFIQAKRSTFGGGINVPFIISWPKGLPARGEVRSQFHHMTDVTPTLLELLHIDAPATYQGRPVKPMEGVSMVYSFSSAEEPTRKHGQYYEIEGQRAYIDGDWKITNWRPEDKHYDEVPWHLYNLREDFSETRDLSQRYPQRVRELERKWWDDARRYNVLPVNDQPLLDRAPWVPPGAQALREHFEYDTSDIDIPGPAQPVLIGRSYTITAVIDRRSDSDGGVIVARGDVYSGWSLFVHDNRLVYENNLPNIGARIVSNAALPVGRTEVGFRFDLTRKPGPLSGRGTLYVGGKVAGTTDLPMPILMGWEHLEVGQDSRTPVSSWYASPATFTGRVERLRFDLDPYPPRPSRTAGKQ
ncbi:MAG: arylsulfatase [Gammaproteobacteria bacterium]